jgi:hypothetical protein
MSDRTIENELWDDESKETKPIYHDEPCGGRTYWIKGEEHRCIKCGKVVPPEEMVLSE